MTEPNPAEAEAPIEDVGEGPPEQDTDNPKAVVDEYDKLDDFNPHDNEGWPDQRLEGGNFEDVAFPPLDEGVK